MGAKLENIVGYASSIVDISWISDNMSEITINIENNLFVLPNAASDLIELILSLFNNLFIQFLIALPNFSFEIYADSLTALETVAGMLLSLPLILLLLSVLSYSIAILSVGETIIFVIFKKIMYNETYYTKIFINNELKLKIYRTNLNLGDYGFKDYVLNRII